MKSYLLWFRDDKKLYACVRHFEVSEETIGYWIREAKEDEEV